MGWVCCGYCGVLEPHRLQPACRRNTQLEITNTWHKITQSMSKQIYSIKDRLCMLIPNPTPFYKLHTCPFLWGMVGYVSLECEPVLLPLIILCTLLLLYPPDPLGATSVPMAFSYLGRLGQPTSRICNIIGLAKFAQRDNLLCWNIVKHQLWWGTCYHSVVLIALEVQS
mgnify:CR=1 FL=1